MNQDEEEYTAECPSISKAIPLNLVQIPSPISASVGVTTFSNFGLPIEKECSNKKLSGQEFAEHMTPRVADLFFQSIPYLLSIPYPELSLNLFNWKVGRLPLVEVIAKYEGVSNNQNGVLTENQTVPNVMPGKARLIGHHLRPRWSKKSILEFKAPIQSPLNKGEWLLEVTGGSLHSASLPLVASLQLPTDKRGDSTTTTTKAITSSGNENIIFETKYLGRVNLAHTPEEILDQTKKGLFASFYSRLRQKLFGPVHETDDRDIAIFQLCSRLAYPPTATEFWLIRPQPLDLSHDQRQNTPGQLTTKSLSSLSPDATQLTKKSMWAHWRQRQGQQFLLGYLLKKFHRLTHTCIPTGYMAPLNEDEETILGPSFQGTWQGAIMLRRNVRLRKEYLYRKSLEDKENLIRDRKRKIKDALTDCKPVAPEDREFELSKRNKLDLEDELSLKPVTTVDDEYAFAGTTDPKILLTTSRDPSNRLQQFVKELNLIIPNAHRVNRGAYVVGDLVRISQTNDVSDIVVVHEHRGVPDGLVVCHLPLGPTVYFGLTEVVLRHDLPQKPPPMSTVAPHLVFENFSSRLGNRISSVLKFLFPPAAPLGKRVLSFVNKEDQIHFRHFIWTDNRHDSCKADGIDKATTHDEAASGDAKANIYDDGKKQGRDKVIKMKANQSVERIELKEIGPRFTLRPYRIELGTMDMKDLEVEWSFKPFLNKRKEALTSQV